MRFTCGVRTALIAIAMAALAVSPSAAQAPIDVYELADYRLSQDVFDRFVSASRRIAEVEQHDADLTRAPLITKDVVLSGDAVAEATALAARLEHHAGLSAALDAAMLTPREYAKFAITLVAAHLAHEFLKAGVLQRVPSGAPTINVEFVTAHEKEVVEALTILGIQANP